MTIIKKPTNCKCWRRCGEKGTLLHCWWECIKKLVQLLRRTVWRFLKKLKIKPPCLCACSVTQSCPTLCSLMDCNLSASFVHGISQAILEWVAISYSRGPFQPKDWTWISCTGSQILNTEPQKPEPTYDPAIQLLGIYLEKNVVQKYTYTRLHCSTVYKSQDMEAT